MTTQQKRVVMNAFIKSQFGYCTLIWMFHSRSANTHINRMHERALRNVCNEYVPTFDELLKKASAVIMRWKYLKSNTIFANR